MFFRKFSVTRRNGYDDAVLSAYAAYPDGDAKFIVQFIHGISEKKERYFPAAEYIADHGGIALVHDLRGHGESVGSAAGLGYFGDFGDNYSTLSQDIDMIFSALTVLPSHEEYDPLIAVDTKSDMEFPDLPRYLYGFSMGALIAGIYASKTPETLAGLILGGLPRHQRMVSLGLIGLSIPELIFGEEHKSKLLNRVAFTAYNGKFTPESESDGQFMWLSNDIGNRREFRDDPVCNHPKTINAYLNLLRLVRDFYRPSSWEMSRRDLPVYITAGEYDPVAGGDSCVLYAQKFLGDIGFRDVRVTMYRGMRHEILRDFGRESVFCETISFIGDTIGDENDRLDAIRAEYEPMFSGKE